MSKEQYNTTLAGERLRERTAFLWRGEKPPSDGKSEEGATFSEHSMAVAEHFVAKLDGDIYRMIALVEKETRQYRKFANESLKQAEIAIKAKIATFQNLKDAKGGPIQAKSDSEFKRFSVVINDYAYEMEQTVSYMLDMLASAPDSEVLEEAQKKGRNGRVKLLADLDAKTYAIGDHVNVGNEYAEGTFYGASMMWDRAGVMKGILRMTAKLAAAMDRDKIADGGECYAVLTGDLPFRKNEKGEAVLSLDLGPQIADYLYIGRAYHRIAEAFRDKLQDLRKLAEEGETAETAKAMAVFQSGVLDDSLKRSEKMKEAAARKKANAPVPIETGAVAAVTNADDEMEAKAARLRAEWNGEMAKGDKADKKVLTRIARQAAVFHPEFAARVEQHKGGLISDGEFRDAELDYGKQILTAKTPTPTPTEG